MKTRDTAMEQLLGQSRFSSIRDNEERIAREREGAEKRKAILASAERDAKERAASINNFLNFLKNFFGTWGVTKNFNMNMGSLSY